MDIKTMQVRLHTPTGVEFHEIERCIALALLDINVKVEAIALIQSTMDLFDENDPPITAEQIAYDNMWRSDQ